jgi:hypothetical protein
MFPRISVCQAFQIQPFRPEELLNRAVITGQSDENPKQKLISPRGACKCQYGRSPLPSGPGAVTRRNKFDCLPVYERPAAECSQKLQTPEITSSGTKILPVIRKPSHISHILPDLIIDFSNNNFCVSLEPAASGRRPHPQQFPPCAIKLR